MLCLRAMVVARARLCACAARCWRSRCGGGGGDGGGGGGGGDGGASGSIVAQRASVGAPFRACAHHPDGRAHPCLSTQLLST